MYHYSCSFYPAYISEDETTLHLFGYCTSGFRQSFLQPFAIGSKVATQAFSNDNGKNNFSPLDYYQKNFKNFPAIEYRYGIVLDFVISPVNKYNLADYSTALIALVSSDESLLATSGMGFIEYKNPSPRNLNW